MVSLQRLVRVFIHREEVRKHLGGCHSFVSPLYTGHAAYSASVSTCSWRSAVLDGVVHPSEDRAVSAVDSLWPIWLRSDRDT